MNLSYLENKMTHILLASDLESDHDDPLLPEETEEEDSDEEALRKKKRVQLEMKKRKKKNSDEPLYCYCQQVSYGEMVACDGEVILDIQSLLFNLYSA